ncbi:MAG: hypothetical protein HZB36_02490 [Candidatus Omnitrophica bacterium]|nr:hypothetical protein [Candidatus Omnitrophota bacterium]
MPDSKQIEITLTLKDEATKRVQSARAAIKEFSNDTKSTLQPILQLRQAWMKTSLAMGFASAVFYGMHSQLKKLREEIDDMDRSSIKLGISTEELSKKMYGFNIATKDARAGANWGSILDYGIKVAGESVKVQIAEKVGWAAQAEAARQITAQRIKQKGWLDFFKKGPKTEWRESWQMAGDQFSALASGIKSTSPEAMKLNVELTAKTKQLALSEFDYRKDLLSQEVKLYGVAAADKQKIAEYNSAVLKRIDEDRTIALTNQQAVRLKAEGHTLEALSLEQENALVEFKRRFGGDGEMVTEFIRGQQAMYAEAKLAYFGLKSEFKIFHDGYIAYIHSMTDTFSNVFYNTVTGQIGSLKETFESFGQSVLKILSDMLAQYLMTKAIMGIGNLFSGGAIVGGVGGSTVNTGAQSIAGHSFTTAWSPYHHGGIIRAHKGLNLASDEVPIIAQTGERVLSRDQNREYMRSKGGITINITPVVQLWDATDIERNKRLLVDAVSQSIVNNGAIRKLMRQYQN